jgi:c-di-GMP-binding flagellar brake protein YcgR
MSFIVHGKKGEKFIIEEQKRNRDRIQISVPVTYAYPGRERIITKQGTSFDVSAGGMGFYSESPLEKGQELKLHAPNIWFSPKTCLVRWCSMKKYNLYRVGVSFQ